MQYAGECEGGPYHGRKQVHYNEIMAFYIMDFSTGVSTPAEYRFKDGKWLWCPPEGREGLEGML